MRRKTSDERLLRVADLLENLPKDGPEAAEHLFYDCSYSKSRRGPKTVAKRIRKFVRERV